MVLQTHKQDTYKQYFIYIHTWFTWKRSAEQRQHSSPNLAASPSWVSNTMFTCSLMTSKAARIFWTAIVAIVVLIGHMMSSWTWWLWVEFLKMCQHGGYGLTCWHDVLSWVLTWHANVTFWVEFWCDILSWHAELSWFHFCPGLWR